MLFVATLVALFSEPLKLLSFILLAGLCFYFIRYAIQHQSFLFLLLSVIYGYIGITYCIFSGLDALGSAGEFTFLLGTFYLFASCGGIISFFIYYKKILGIKKWKYLKTPQKGITFEKEIDEDNFFKTNIEAIIIAQSFSQQADSIQTESTTEFGDGEFGGAGSGGKF